MTRVVPFSSTTSSSFLNRVQKDSDLGAYSGTHSQSLEAAFADGTNGPSGNRPAGRPGNGFLSLVSGCREFSLLITGIPPSSLRRLDDRFNFSGRPVGQDDRVEAQNQIGLAVEAAGPLGHLDVTNHVAANGNYNLIIPGDGNGDLTKKLVSWLAGLDADRPLRGQKDLGLFGNDETVQVLPQETRECGQERSNEPW